MNQLIYALSELHDRIFNAIEDATEGWLLGFAARLVFPATLLVYFWTSGLTKIGEGLFGFLSPSDGAYIQIFPKAFEEAGYDSSAFGFVPDMIVLFGTWAEFILPLLIVIGLFTRLSALAFIGFICVMSYVDIYGHGADAATIGAFFDKDASSLISDQRLFWGFLMLVLVIKGAGKISIDALLSSRNSL
ncbi:MAG: DoxX family protein [Rhizobiales bacterium]|nr:DoxX family protein [Hyphomicrobiales bacterium]